MSPDIWYAGSYRQCLTLTGYSMNVTARGTNFSPVGAVAQRCLSASSIDPTAARFSSLRISQNWRPPTNPRKKIVLFCGPTPGTQKIPPLLRSPTTDQSGTQLTACSSLVLIQRTILRGEQCHVIIVVDNNRTKYYYSSLLLY